MQTTDPDIGLSQETPTPSTVSGAPHGHEPAPPPEFENFKSGDIIGGDYQLMDLLGRGGMGMVFTARHVSMEAVYALKVLLTNQVTENKVMRFQNEAQAIAKLNHPNIIAIYNFGLHKGKLPFYVMELLDGENLQDKLKEHGPAPLASALPLFIEVCAGLGHAHKKGILHRDVKPANIVILKEPDVRGAKLKVVDFGVVKFAEEIKPDIQKLTAIGAVCGSPSYMSPEQSSAQRIDPRSDIYSLGCSLYQTLTGKVPFHGRNGTETMLAHHEQPVPSLESKGDGRTYPEDLELLVAKMLAKAPMDRYQTMDAVAQDMKNILEGKPLGTMQLAAPPASYFEGYDTDFSPSAGQSHYRLQSRNPRITAHDIKQQPLSGSGNAHSPEMLAANAGYAQSQNCQAQGLNPPLPGEDSVADYTADDAIQASARRPIQIMAGIFAVCVLGAGVFCARQFMPGKSDVKPGATNNGAPADMTKPQAPHVLESEKTLQHQEMVDPGELEQSAPVKLTSEKYFSKTVTINGRTYIEFNFPAASKGEALAWIASSIGDSQRTEGRVTLAKGPPIFLMPLKGAVGVPQFFDKFRPGEIAGFVLGPTTASDKMFELVARVPGVSQVMIGRCPQLTDKIMPTLSRLNLTMFNAPGISIPGEALAKARFWPNLTLLNLARGKNITPVLQKLVGSKNLKTLDLSETKLSSNDFKLISKIHSLNALNLTGARMSPEDMRALSTLPKLDTLSLVYLKYSGGSIVQEIKHFPALRDLIVLSNYFRAEELLQLRQECPRLRVKELVPGQLSGMSKNTIQEHW